MGNRWSVGAHVSFWALVTCRELHAYHGVDGTSPLNTPYNCWKGTRGHQFHSNSRTDLLGNSDPVEPPGWPQLVLPLGQAAFCKLPDMRREGSRSPRFDGGGIIKGRRCFPQPSLLFFFSFIFISWRLITLQYCSSPTLLLKDVSSYNFTYGVTRCLVLQNKWPLEALRL